MTISIEERQLRQLVRSLLAESVPPPDEPRMPPDSELGRYVFPDDRIDPRYSDISEDNTELEDKFYRALKSHYENNDHSALKSLWPRVWPLVKSGMYPSLLVPPRSRRAFRLLNTNAARAAEILGVSRDDVIAEPGSARSAVAPPTYNPRGFISSWTLEPQFMVTYTGPEFVHVRSGVVTILLVADLSSGGDFIMNPAGFAQSWNLGQQYSHESEVIGGGPIVLSAASWMFHGQTMSPSSSSGGEKSGGPPRSKRMTHTSVLKSLLSAVRAK